MLKRRYEHHHVQVLYHNNYMCEAEEKHMTSSHFGGGRGCYTGDLSTGLLCFPQ